MAKGCTTLQVGSTHYGNMTADRRPWQVHLETKGRQYDKTFTIALKRNGGAPFGGWRHHLSPSSRGHYGCSAVCHMTPKENIESLILPPE